MTDSNISSISIARNSKIDQESISDSFLSILYDKNKVIESLRTQQKNQKMQILYYMRKDLSNSKLINLSETCNTQIIEENIPVVLAMDNFKRKNGFKSNMHHLYEYMRNLDEKLVLSLQGQEFILRKVVGKLCKFLKQADGNIQLKIQLGKLLSDKSYVDLFQRLTEATMGLQGKLEAFRLSCNRLLLVEDERNFIAEQVLTLPVNQRINYNFLVGIKMQNSELEKQVKLIERDREVQKNEICELGVIEKKLSKLQNYINSSFNENNELSSVEQMVESLEYEATHLLNMTAKYKEKQQSEVSSIKNMNVSLLNKILNFIRSAIEDEDFDATKFFPAQEQPVIFDRILKEINAAKAKISRELDRTKSENEALKSKLNKALLDKNEMKFAYCQLQKDFDDFKAELSEETSRLRIQRDNYRSQVEELAMIREAYTKIVDQPSRKNNAPAPEIENELYERNLRLENRVKLMKNIIDKQNKEIALQCDFIENLKDFNKRTWRKNPILKTSQISNSNHTSSEKNSGVSDENSEEILMSGETFNWTDSNICNRKQGSCFSNLENSSSLSCYKFYSENKQVMKEIMRTVIKEEEKNGKMSMSSFALKINRMCRGKEKKKIFIEEHISDFELMKDTSQEEISEYCLPVRKECARDHSGDSFNDCVCVDSKPITVLAMSNNRASSSSEENPYLYL